MSQLFKLLLNCQEDKAELARLLLRRDAEIERLKEALHAYRDAVRVDAQMDGPKFMGCNASQLKRAWELEHAALKGEEGK